MQKILVKFIIAIAALFIGESSPAAETAYLSLKQGQAAEIRIGWHTHINPVCVSANIFRGFGRCNGCELVTVGDTSLPKSRRTASPAS